MSSSVAAVEAGNANFVHCEVLYFIQNKCSVLPFDSAVSISSDFYTTSEVESARAVAAEILSPSKRVTKHSGQEDVRRKKTIQDHPPLLDRQQTAVSRQTENLTELPAVQIPDDQSRRVEQDLNIFESGKCFVFTARQLC